MNNKNRGLITSRKKIVVALTVSLLAVVALSIGITAAVLASESSETTYSVSADIDNFWQEWEETTTGK